MSLNILLIFSLSSFFLLFLKIKMSKLTITLFSVFFITLFSCERFNSNKYNYEKIQGEWQLCNIEDKAHKENESIANFPILYFDKNICIEHFPKTDKKNIYYFSINNYFITFNDTIHRNVTHYKINKLSDDSLILDNQLHLYYYIPVKKQQ